MTFESALTTFTLFPKLPVELRLKIWGFVLPPPRNVRVYFKPTYRWQRSNSWRSPEPAPTILHICQESREEGLKHYQIAFATYVSPGRIYFDYSRDTLVFGCGGELPLDGHYDPDETYLLGIFLSADHGVTDSDRIRKMQFDLDDELYDRAPGAWDDIRLFPALETLTIQCWEGMIGTLALQAPSAKEAISDTLRYVARSHPDWKIPRTLMISRRAKTVLWEYPNPEDEAFLKAVKEERL